MKMPLVVGNWKMNLLASEAANLAIGIQDFSQKIPDVKVVLAPAFTLLHIVKQVISKSNVGLACQNFYFREKGAYTGEVSFEMVKDAGCQYAIVGHSERRKLFDETNEMVNKKIVCAVKNDISVIVCVGENEEERSKGRTFEIIESQVCQALFGLTNKSLNKVCIAYEPVWAIGTGVNATVDQVEEAHNFIRKIISKKVLGKEDISMDILYGGSVNPDNCKDLLRNAEVNGALVGGASLNINSFCDIIKAASST